MTGDCSMGIGDPWTSEQLVVTGEQRLVTGELGQGLVTLGLVNADL